MAKCCVRSCRNGRNKGVALFTFPADAERASLWSQELSLGSADRKTFVCEAHFHRKDVQQLCSIKRGGPRPRVELSGRKRLRPSAIPSLHVQQSPPRKVTGPRPIPVTTDYHGDRTEVVNVSPVTNDRQNRQIGRPYLVVQLTDHTSNQAMSSGNLATPSGNLETSSVTKAADSSDLATPFSNQATSSCKSPVKLARSVTKVDIRANPSTLPSPQRVDDKVTSDDQTYSYFVVKTKQPNLPIPKHWTMVGKIASNTILEPEQCSAGKRSTLGVCDDLFIKLEHVEDEMEAGSLGESFNTEIQMGTAGVGEVGEGLSSVIEVVESETTDGNETNSEKAVPVPDEVRIIYPRSILTPPALTRHGTDNGGKVTTVSEALRAVLKEPEQDAWAAPLDHSYVRTPDHVCSVCGLGYASFQDFSVHVLRHLNQECKFCGLLLDTSKKFHAHFPSVGNELECEICKKVLSCMGRLKEHEKNHGEAVMAKPAFRCGICDRVFFDIRNYTKHYATHKRCMTEEDYTRVTEEDHSNTERDVTQAYCSSEEYPASDGEQQEPFDSQEQPLHDGEQHSDTELTGRSFRCGRCPCYFKSRSKRQTHLEEVHNLSSLLEKAKEVVRKSKIKTVKTAKKRQREEMEKEDCETEANRAADELGKGHESTEKPRTKRVRKRKPAKPKKEREPKQPIVRQCDVCGKTFKTSQLLVAHIKHVHENKREHLCTTCGKRFNLESHLKLHMRKVHPDTDTNVVCELCGLKLKNKAYLRAHRMIHSGDKPFTCEKCGVSYRRKAILMRHMLLHTDEPGPYSCELCGRDFKTGTEIRRHMRFKHVPGEKPAARVECETCGKSFAEKYLPFHRRRNHRARVENSGICEFCGKRSKSKAAFDLHRRTHTGEKPYVCNICDRRFAAFGVLHAHKRTHTGEKPYVCKVCGKGFAQSGALKYHLRVHTGERPYACDRCEKRFKLRSHLKAHIEYHDRMDGKIGKRDVEKTTLNDDYCEEEVVTIFTPVLNRQ